MKLKEIPKEDLELMSYDELAALILQESGKKMKLPDIFKKVCEVLELPDSVFESQLMDFFELMSINKKFIMLKNGFWDLQSRHKADIVIEDGDEEEIIETSDEIEDTPNDDENEDIFYDKDDETDDEVDDDLSDLMIVDSEEENNGE